MLLKIFTGKHLWQSRFFNKVAGLRPATLFKKRRWYRSFPVNFANFQEYLFIQNTSGGCFCPNFRESRHGIYLKTKETVKRVSLISAINHVWSKYIWFGGRNRRNKYTSIKIYSRTANLTLFTLHKKWSFQLRIF